MFFYEYWENVVGKVARTTEEIETKLDELTEFLLNIIEKYAVIPENASPNQEKRKNYRKNVERRKSVNEI